MDEILFMDVFDGRHDYVGTRDQIVAALIDAVDPATVDIMALAAAVHGVEPLDVMVTRVGDEPF